MSAPDPLRADTLGAIAGRVPIPGYDRSRVTTGVVHVGVGGFHRAHQAAYHDRLMNAGKALEWGICGVGVMPADRRMDEALGAQDGLYTLVEKHPDGSRDARVIGAVIGHRLAAEDGDGVIERMAAPSTRIVSLTVTEGATTSTTPPAGSRPTTPTSCTTSNRALRRGRRSASSSRHFGGGARAGSRPSR